MGQIVWFDESVGQLALIVDYIALFNPVAANKVGTRLLAAAESLQDFPRRGRAAGNGKRELVTVPAYIPRYQETDGDVLIVSIRHGAQAPAED